MFKSNDFLNENATCTFFFTLSHKYFLLQTHLSRVPVVQEPYLCRAASYSKLAFTLVLFISVMSLATELSEMDDWSFTSTMMTSCVEQFLGYSLVKKQKNRTQYTEHELPLVDQLCAIFPILVSRATEPISSMRTPSRVTWTPMKVQSAVRELLICVLAVDILWPKLCPWQWASTP